MTAVELRLDHADTDALLARQTHILEQIATGAALAEVLTGIAATLEQLVPECRCSVLLLDRDSSTLHHGAAPSLPTEYSDGIDGLSIGANAGSCGTAAYTGHPVIAADIQSDPRWENYRGLASDFGLRACWSTPIRGRDGICGTFAVYHLTPHRPSPREEHLVERLTHLASIAIDHDAAQRERRRRAEAELARNAAESANRAKTDFVSALGHELRTPLQAITGFTELLATLDLDSERRSVALSHITAAADHILTMVNDVLDVARIEARVLPVDIGTFSLTPVVTSVFAMVERLAAAERVSLLPCTAPPVNLLADERRVRQVLLNLMTNAIRYNRVGGTVLLDWTVRDSIVRITVSDTGPGIPAGQLDRLFTPFDRLGRDSEEGIGLGVPLARGLTEAMGGTLVVTSEISVGTVVTVTLPTALPAGPSATRPAATDHGGAEARDPSGRPSRPKRAT